MPMPYMPGQAKSIPTVYYTKSYANAFITVRQVLIYINDAILLNIYASDCTSYCHG